MRCTVPSKCIKTFGRAVHCLAKIGEELYLEGLPSGLALKASNCSRTAFASFLFRGEFFLVYTDGSTRGRTGEETAKCKLAMRPFLNVFKSIASLERAVDHCSIHLDTGHCKLILQFHYKQGLVRSHHFGYEDCESLQAIFSKEACPNLMAGPTDLFREVAAHFPQNLEEICLSAARDRLCFRTYFEDERVPAKQGITEISLAPAEFDEYSIQLNTCVVFSLKTMRALLVFAESGSHKLELRLEDSGKPVIASLEVFGGCEVDMVLATLVDPEPHAEPAPGQVSTSVTVSTGVDLQEGVLSGCDNRTSSAARQQTVPGPLALLKDELMDFECSVSPVPSPPPSLQLETTAEMRCQQTWAKCGSSTNGAVATTKVVEGTGLLGEALDDADFGFSRKLSHEAATSQHSELASALFGDDSLPDDVGEGLSRGGVDDVGEGLSRGGVDDVGEGLSGGGVDDDIADSMVIPGTPQAKRHKPSLLWEGAPAAPDWDSSTPPPASPLPRVLAPDSDPEEEDESL